MRLRVTGCLSVSMAVAILAGCSRHELAAGDAKDDDVVDIVQHHLRKSVDGGWLGAVLGDVSAAVHADLLGRPDARDSQARLVDELVEDCRKGFESCERPSDRVDVICRQVFDARGVQPESDDVDVSRLFPGAALEQGRGSCVALSCLLLVVAERLDVPMSGVLVPGHLFVRYDDGAERFNAETIRRGLRRTDAFYLERFPVPEHSSCYMRALSADEVLAVCLYNVANAYRDVGRAEDATATYEIAAAVLPGMAECRGNLGVAYLDGGDVARAIGEFRATVSANPLLGGAYLNLGAAYVHAGRHDDAESAYRAGLAASPDDEDLLAALRAVTDVSMLRR